MLKTITLTRDSVALTDDIDALHTLDIKIDEDWKIDKIINYIISLDYLPIIQKRKTTWSMNIKDNPVAILSQKNFHKPLMICHADYPFQKTVYFVQIDHIHFKYHAQRKPKLVLKDFKL